MASSKVIVFWVRKLFYDLKLLPCVFFLSYVMGSEGDHYEPVVREKEGQGETVMLYGFSWDVSTLRKGNWSLSLGLLDSTHLPFPGPLVAFGELKFHSGNRDNFQDPRELLGTEPVMEDPGGRVSTC